MTESVRAELAVARGELGPIVEHLRVGTCSAEVLQSLSRYLRKAGTPRWHLVFTVRNGRPSFAPGSIWQRGEEKRVGEKLLLLSQNPGASDVGLLRELANALDPNGATKWKLVFKRPNKRVGRPNDRPVRKLLELAVLGHKAHDLHDELGTWRLAHEKLGHPANPNEPSNKLKAAKRLVRPRRNPLD